MYEVRECTIKYAGFSHMATGMHILYELSRNSEEIGSFGYQNVEDGGRETIMK